MLTVIISLFVSAAWADEMAKIAPNTYVEQWKATATFAVNLLAGGGLILKFLWDLIFKRQDKTDDKHDKLLAAFNDFKVTINREVGELKSAVNQALNNKTDVAKITEEIEDRIEHKVELWVMRHFKALVKTLGK